MMWKMAFEVFGRVEDIGRGQFFFFFFPFLCFVLRYMTIASERERERD